MSTNKTRFFTRAERRKRRAQKVSRTDYRAAHDAISEYHKTSFRRKKHYSPAEKRAITLHMQKLQFFAEARDRITAQHLGEVQFVPIKSRAERDRIAKLMESGEPEFVQGQWSKRKTNKGIWMKTQASGKYISKIKYDKRRKGIVYTLGGTQTVIAAVNPLELAKHPERYLKRLYKEYGEPDEFKFMNNGFEEQTSFTDMHDFIDTVKERREKINITRKLERNMLKQFGTRNVKEIGRLMRDLQKNSKAFRDAVQYLNSYYSPWALGAITGVMFFYSDRHPF